VIDVGSGIPQPINRRSASGTCAGGSVRKVGTENVR
jgi:hypothetical protein